MLVNRLFYAIKPWIPRALQISLRSALVRAKRQRCKDIWPIDPLAGKPPAEWSGWPEGKRFALVLTHDVESLAGHDKCERLMQLEVDRGFRSCFNFVPEKYPVSPALRETMAKSGFEVGVHGLIHDGKLYSSQRIFAERAAKINRYLKEWRAVGFRSPAMHHNLDWIHELDIAYDMSTFDTDPFEPQSDGVRTIFPFYVNNSSGQGGYLELPYTMPQDFTVFVLMKETSIGIWKDKLDWIAKCGGMALVNVHPDYMSFNDEKPRLEEYSSIRYVELLEYIIKCYGEDCCQLLPAELVSFLRKE
jgi:peptidoglycan/xylan/chitin deacetylase (PgdA/CDA1 family)